MKNFYLVIKYLLAMTVMIAVVIILAACATIPYSQDIPAKVVEWSETNVWKVISRTKGTAFWIDDQLLITACHIVKDGKKVFIQHGSWKWTVNATVEFCSESLDLAILKYEQDTPDDLKGFAPLPTVIADQNPTMGKRVYSAGYTLGAVLQLNPGYMQNLTDFGLSISIPTEIGDSGAPVIRYEKGKITVVGVRTEVATYPMRFGIEQTIAHIAFIRDVELIKKAINEHKRKG